MVTRPTVGYSGYICFCKCDTSLESESDIRDVIARQIHLSEKIVSDRREFLRWRRFSVYFRQFSASFGRVLVERDLPSGLQR